MATDSLSLKYSIASVNWVLSDAWALLDPAALSNNGQILPFNDGDLCATCKWESVHASGSIIPICVALITWWAGEADQPQSCGFELLQHLREQSLGKE